MFNHTIKVLDHGLVTLRNIAGPTRREWQAFDAADVDPANAARMSFDQMDSDRTEEMDLKLCGYLMKNRHTSPFEMIQVWLEMKLPIFVARQFVRHRTVRLNEMSGRYIILPDEFYIPEIIGGKAKSAKQGQENSLSRELQESVKLRMIQHCTSGFELYNQFIDEGVAPEHARIILGLNTYTHWLWNQDMHNLMHFLSLRDHSHAQIEAQMYAQAIDTLIRRVLPNTMALYDQFRKQP